MLSKYMHVYNLSADFLLALITDVIHSQTLPPFILNPSSNLKLKPPLCAYSKSTHIIWRNAGLTELCIKK